MANRVSAWSTGTGRDDQSPSSGPREVSSGTGMVTRPKHGLRRMMPLICHPRGASMTRDDRYEVNLPVVPAGIRLDLQAKEAARLIGALRQRCWRARHRITGLR